MSHMFNNIYQFFYVIAAIKILNIIIIIMYEENEMNKFIIKCYGPVKEEVECLISINMKLIVERL